MIYAFLGLITLRFAKTLREHFLPTERISRRTRRRKKMYVFLESPPSPWGGKKKK